MGDNNTVLLTGACGFLGSRIAKRLSAAGYRVVGIDRCESADPSLSDHHVMSLPDQRFFEILAAETPGAVVHTAGPASVVGSVDDPLADFNGSVATHAFLFDAVRRFSPDSRVVMLSSAAVYGDPVSLPVHEDAPLAPISPYGFHKIMCETLAREFHVVYGVRTCALRIFSAYGAGLRRQILWDVCEKAVQGHVELMGSGQQTRDFVHTDDVAAAIECLLASAPFEGEAYNCASGVETTIRELAEKLAACVNPAAPVSFSGVDRPGDPMRWRADISALSRLGFKPSVAFDDGVAEYCAWYQQQRERS